MGLIDKIKNLFKIEIPKQEYNGATPSKSIPAGLDPSKEYCGSCGIHYDSSFRTCPHCNDDEDIDRIRRSYD